VGRSGIWVNNIMFKKSLNAKISNYEKILENLPTELCSHDLTSDLIILPFRLLGT